ncbi:hypothetical protein [Streptomyces sp. URMC 129]|uniref:hypothetical protein n=1 Tax=Streptomyces sp. URMC 129 TaxID=3423407 RepID=UPI003F19A31D
MGIEGEKLVFDYLSRVGDLAHGTSMSAAQRASLVNRLRDEIGRQRAAAGGAESQAAVRRILGRMGRPEDLVAEAVGSSPAPAAAPTPAAPATPVPGPRVPAEPVAGSVPPPPAPAGAVDAGAAGAGAPPAAGPDPGGWFGRPAGFWPDGQIGLFRGGIDNPDVFRSPAKGKPDAGDPAPEQENEEAPAPAPAVEKGPSRGRRLARAALTGRRVGGPVELLGVALLLAGTVMGSVVVLGLGWAAAYWSPRLGRREAQWAAFGMPALVAGAYLGWLLGRAGGYWGAELAPGEAQATAADHVPWLLRGAAVASAAFLFHRARRHRPPADAS